MKILVDMNLSPSWADFLMRNGIEAVHWSSVGSPDAPDTEILYYSKSHDFTVLTCDLDFGFILSITHGEKPSVIQMRTGVLSASQTGNIAMSAIKLLSDDIEKGALVTIDPHKTRVTLLPL
jgi:predicted nuclease of predicted toxin-antitoxin system